MLKNPLKKSVHGSRQHCSKYILAYGLGSALHRSSAVEEHLPGVMWHCEQEWWWRRGLRAALKKIERKKVLNVSFLDRSGLDTDPASLLDIMSLCGTAVEKMQLQTSLRKNLQVFLLPHSFSTLPLLLYLSVFLFFCLSFLWTSFLSPVPFSLNPLFSRPLSFFSSHPDFLIKLLSPLPFSFLPFFLSFFCSVTFLSLYTRPSHILKT